MAAEFERGVFVNCPLMSKLSIASAALAAAALAVGCTPKPGYPPPPDQEAKAAVLRALHADLIDSPGPPAVPVPNPVGPRDTPNSAMGKVGGAMQEATELEDRRIALSSVQSLQRVAVSGCRWGKVNPKAVRPYGRDRAKGVGFGYRCAYEEVHDTPSRGLVSAPGEAYFFHRDGAYDFAGIKQGNYEAVAAGQADGS